MRNAEINTTKLLLIAIYLQFAKINGILRSSALLIPFSSHPVDFTSHNNNVIVMTLWWCVVYVVAFVPVGFKFIALLLAAIAAFLMSVDRNCINITKYVAIEVTVCKVNTKWKMCTIETGSALTAVFFFFL